MRMDYISFIWQSSLHWHQQLSLKNRAIDSRIKIDPAIVVHEKLHIQLPVPKGCTISNVIFSKTCFMLCNDYSTNNRTVILATSHAFIFPQFMQMCGLHHCNCCYKLLAYNAIKSHFKHKCLVG